MPIARPQRTGPKLRRETITVHGVTGPQHVAAWIHDPFAIHRSLGARGYSLTHLRSGKKILSRIRSRADAEAAIAPLRAVLDWDREDIPVDDLQHVWAGNILDTIPRVPLKAPLRDPFRDRGPPA
jgi:hypothetical protein